MQIEKSSGLKCANTSNAPLLDIMAVLFNEREKLNSLKVNKYILPNRVNALQSKSLVVKCKKCGGNLSLTQNEVF